MNILILACSGMPIQGGVEYKQHHLANALVARGNHVVLMSKRIPDPQRIMDWLTVDYEWRSYWLPRTRGVMHTQLVYAYLLHEKLRSSPDILAASMAWPCGVWATSIKRLLGIPVVVVTEAADVQDRPDLADSYNSPRVKNQVRQALLKADAVTAVCRATRQDCIKLGANRHWTRVIPNGVELDLLRRSLAFETPARRYILSISRARPVKGIDILLRAFQIVSEQMPEIDLVIVGVDADNPYQELMTDLGIGPRVQFVGTVPSQRKWELLRGCELFVIPSRSEAFPLVAVEAMAAGKPLVVSSVGCLPEIVQDGINGILISPGDVNALAQAMVRLLATPTLLHDMGQRSRRLASRYDWVRIADQYLELFASVLTRYHV